MLLWLALFIPIVTTVVLHVFWHHKVVIWEYVIPLMVSLVLITICYFAVQHYQTTDTEYWGGIVVKAEYYERWDERVPCSHPEYCTRSDSQGNMETYQCGNQHAYDVDDHPPYWQVVNTNNTVIRVSKGKYQELVKKFDNQKFVDLRRSYHMVDGDKYETRWDRSVEKAEITTTSHSYTNKVKPSRSVFNYAEVTPTERAQYALYPYPSIRNHYDLPPILGRSPAATTEAQRAFQLLNGYYGSFKQMRVWVMLFPDQPREAGFLQESLWVGGHKNEFVVTIGLDSAGKVSWAHVFSWTGNERLKLETRYWLEEQEELDLIEFSNWLQPELVAGFVRKEFSDFDYLRIEPPIWAVLLTYFLTLLTNVLVSLYVIRNQYYESLRYG